MSSGRRTGNSGRRCSRRDPVAGDPELGKAYMDMTRPFVWTASKRDNFVYDCQQMRKRVEDLIPAPLKDRAEIKLGRGGLRDVEFTVQMLQLVHGRSDESLRTAPPWNRCRRWPMAGTCVAQASKKTFLGLSLRTSDGTPAANVGPETHLFPDLPNASRRHRAIARRRCGCVEPESRIAQAARAFPPASGERRANTTRPAAKYATCTWTSTIARCCRSMPA